jgi:hypothetical protein
MKNYSARSSDTHATHIANKKFLQAVAREVKKFQRAVKSRTKFSASCRTPWKTWARGQVTHTYTHKKIPTSRCAGIQKNSTFNRKTEMVSERKVFVTSTVPRTGDDLPVCDTTAPLDGTTHSYQVQHVSHALPCTNSVRTALAHVQATYGEARNMKTHVSTYCAYNNSNNCRIYSAFWAHIYFAQYS